VGGLDELEFSEDSFVLEFLHVEVLAGIDDGLRHHVLEAGLFD
jgi:hypothetical protein